MNRYTRLVLKGFQSDANKRELGNELTNAFNDAEVYKFVEANLDKLVDNFAKTWEVEMLNSDPIAGLSVNEQINMLNAEFLEDRSHFIKAQVLGDQERPNTYILHDGGPATSRNGLKHFQQKPDNILASWKRNSGRGMTTREDTQSDTYAHNPYHFSSNYGGMTTGITVCDQSEIGTSQHVDTFYNDTNFRLLNGLDKGQKLWGGAFGDATPESDARLLSRRVFRSNERGEENGIPVYEQRLYRRNLERDVGEAMSGRERGCAVYKHDMRSLYDRVDQRRTYAAQHPHMRQYS